MNYPKTFIFIIFIIFIFIISCSQSVQLSDNNENSSNAENNQISELQGINGKSNGVKQSVILNSAETEKNGTIIFSEGFDSEKLDWLQSSPAIVVRQKESSNDNYTLLFRRNADIYKNISTKGYSDITISFKLKSSLENVQFFGTEYFQEKFIVSYYDGLAWETITEIKESTDDYTYYEFNIPSKANNNPDFQIRFWASTVSYDLFNYIDEIKLVGLPVILLGDVNKDGNINDTDSLLTAQYSADLKVENFFPEYADVNGDGKVNIIDALLIAQYFEGKISKFPVQ